MAKYMMSMCVIGLSEEFKGKVGVNALWPKTLIATAAVKVNFGGDPVMQMSRNTDIMADAAYIVLTSDAKTTTGQFFVDDEVVGPIDLKKYNVDPNNPVEKIIPCGFNY